MPISNRSTEAFVKSYIVGSFAPEARILDVGPGAGLNHEMLKDTYSNIDGVEVFEPYVAKYNLLEKYNQVFVQNVVDFDQFANYDLAIMGDVLEHLTITDSVKVLSNMRAGNCKGLIQVPYQYVQGIVEGNVHEIHIQDDLTAEIMQERYGEFLTRIHLDGFMAVYVTK